MTSNALRAQRRFGIQHYYHRNLQQNLENDIENFKEKIRQKQQELAENERKLRESQQAYERDFSTTPEEAERSAEETIQQAENTANPRREIGRFTRDMLLKVWEADARNEGYDAGLFAITQESPDFEQYQNRLLLYGDNNRIWKGTFHTENETDAEGLATFKYIPKADEINPEIPNWARQEIAGKLEWKIVLQQDGTHGTPRLKVQYYPGEVEWDEEAIEGQEKSAYVSGEGEPREFIYSPIVHQVTTGIYGAPEVDIYLDRSEKNDPRLLEGLLKRQKFFIFVKLPPDLAKKHGDKISVKIKGELGDETSIELKAGRKDPLNNMTPYKHYTPVAFGDIGDSSLEDYKPMTGSVNWIMGKVWGNEENHPGSRLPLSITSGEHVSISWGGSSYTIPVYDTWIQRGIARQLSAYQKLKGFFTMITESNQTSDFAKKDARFRLQLLNNYKAIMNSEEAHDLIRYHIGEKYLGSAFAESGMFDARMLAKDYDSIAATKTPVIHGLVGQSEWHLTNTAERGGLNYWEKFGYDVYKLPEPGKQNGIPDRKGYFKNVEWAHPLEKAIIEISAYNTNEELWDKLWDEIPLAIGYAMYTGIASASNMDTLYMYVFGENIMGQKVQEWEKRTAGVGFVLGMVLTFRLPHIEMEMPNLKGFSLRGTNKIKRLKAQQKLSESEMLQISNLQKTLKAKARLNEIPDNLLVTMKIPGIGKPKKIYDSWNQPITCAKTKSSRAQAFKEKLDSSAGAIVPYEFRDLKGRIQTADSVSTSQGEQVGTTIKSSKNAPGSTPPPRPDNFIPAQFKNVDVAKDVDAVVLQEAYNMYLEVEAIGSKLAAPQKFELCNCMFYAPEARRILNQDISELRMHGRASKFADKDAPPMVFEGVPDKVTVALAQDIGFKTVLYNDQILTHLDWELYNHFVEEGMVVRLVVRPKNQRVGHEADHAVRLRRFGRNNDGDIIDITFFDPAFGRDIRMNIEAFKKIAVEGHPLLMMHPKKDITMMDLRTGAVKKVEARGGNWTERASNDNTPTTPGLDETWHDGVAPNANNGAIRKSLNETWDEGVLEMPLPKDMDTAPHNPASPQLLGPNDTQIMDAIKIPDNIKIHPVDPKGRVTGGSDDSVSNPTGDETTPNPAPVVPTLPPSSGSDDK